MTERPEDQPTEECSSHAALPDETIEIINDALQEDEHDLVDKHISELSPADIGDLMEKLSDGKRKKIIKEHRDELDAEDYAEIDEDVRKKILESMPATEVAEIVDELDSDDALDITLNLEEDFRRDIIRHLSAKTRNVLEEGYAFPEDSAGRLMQREFVAIPEFWSVGQAIDYMRDSAEDLPESFSDIFIVTPTYHVVGEIPLYRLVISCRDEKLKDLSLEGVLPIHADMDQEEAAHIFRRENLNSAPIVDKDNRLIGVITIDDIVDVIDEEAEEDILKLGGLEQSDMYSAVWTTSILRFKWLFVNLLTAILASSVISLFDATISELVALAVLMPIVASMGGNAGTQALTIAIRAIATKELSSTNALRIIGKETMVGTINGSAFAVISGVVAGLWFSNPVLGAVIASAMLINLIIAGLCGAGIPIALNRMGSDPAISSTVVLTTITDVIGFFAFLGLAAVFLV